MSAPRLRALLAGILATSAVPPGALAQEVPSAQHFRASADGVGWFAGPSAVPLGLLSPTASTTLSLAAAPAVVRDGDGALLMPVGALFAADIQAALGLPFGDVGVVVPVVLVQAGSGLDPREPPPTSAFGDVAIVPKFALPVPRRLPLALAVVVPVTLPTGAEGGMASEPSVTARPEVVAELRRGQWRVSARVGLVARADASAYGARRGVQASWGLAAALRAHPRVEVLGEAWGEVGLERRDFPAEWLAGVRVDLGWGLRASAAAGTGLTPAWGVPAFRAVVGLGWVRPGPRDRDFDGIVDLEDRCPDAAEDGDGYEDGDGCPDPDNDGDGLLDRRDLCPDAPEAWNGIEDDDGCPEEGEVGDADGDGHPDYLDRCPEDAEDPDGHRDDDGCPDEDNDRDGIVDVRDRCPDEAEVRNGIEDEDGCPDEGRARIAEDAAERRVIRIRDAIFFETGTDRLDPSSETVLDDVARLLLARPPIRLVEVQGHADARGDAESNRVLTQKRAEAVVRYLVTRGVDAKRLFAKGYGADVPIDPASTEEAWAR
ncbi:OmpA family protein, partial [Myxococcota bacterium]|nr:OmpA family protein [Myxococcota bacterium]